MKKSFLFPLTLLLALAGCEATVDVAPPPHTPRLALTYTLSNQGPTADYRQFFDNRTLYVSTSQGVFETQKLDGRADATVELRDATGQVVEQFRARGRTGYGRPDSLRGYYVPTRGYVGRPGQAYTLRASAPGVAAVEATMSLPAPAAVEAASYAPKAVPGPGNGSNPSGRLSFTVPDNAATTDYYLAYARVLDAAGRPWGQVQIDYSARNNNGPDIDFNRNHFKLSVANNRYDTFPFSDAGSNGQRLTSTSDVVLSYTGKYDPQHPTPPAPAFIEVIVSSISADAYDFYQSVQRYYDTEGNPFAEPAPLHSNVAPGYGLFGGAADVSFRVPL